MCAPWLMQMFGGGGGMGGVDSGPAKYQDRIPIDGSTQIAKRGDFGAPPVQPPGRLPTPAGYAAGNTPLTLPGASQAAPAPGPLPATQPAVPPQAVPQAPGPMPVPLPPQRPGMPVAPAAPQAAAPADPYAGLPSIARMAIQAPDMAAGIGNFVGGLGENHPAISKNPPSWMPDFMNRPLYESVGLPSMEGLAGVMGGVQDAGASVRDAIGMGGESGYEPPVARGPMPGPMPEEIPQYGQDDARNSQSVVRRALGGDGGGTYSPPVARGPMPGPMPEEIPQYSQEDARNSQSVVRGQTSGVGQPEMLAAIRARLDALRNGAGDAMGTVGRTVGPLVNEAGRTAGQGFTALRDAANAPPAPRSPRPASRTNGNRAQPGELPMRY
jgi:hypothetical protein